MLRLGSLILFLFALAAGGNAAYLQLKAALAQHLLDLAWSNSQLEGKPVKPWPWADTWPVARLSIPELDKTLIVLEGTSGEAMAFGPGRLTQSALSVSGVVGIGGHRDTHLAFLEDLPLGSLLELELINGQQAQYIYAHQQILDTRRDSLKFSTTNAGLVLITCYPFSASQTGGPMRYVATAVPFAKLNMMAEHEG